MVGQKKEKDQVVESRKLDYELLDRWITYIGKTTDKYKDKGRVPGIPEEGDAGCRWWTRRPRRRRWRDGRSRWASSGGGASPGGANSELKKMADEFQADVVRVMLERKSINEENEIITAKSLEGTKKKKRANEPNEFITNDDFCPGCGAPAEDHAGGRQQFSTPRCSSANSRIPTIPMAMLAENAPPQNRVCCCSAVGAWRAA